MKQEWVVIFEIEFLEISFQLSQHFTLVWPLGEIQIVWTTSLHNSWQFSIFFTFSSLHSYLQSVVPLTSGSLWPHLHFQSSKGYTHTPRRWRGKSHWTSNWYWQFYGNGQCSALSLLKLVKLHFDLKKWLFIIVLVWGPRFLFFFNIEYQLIPSISSMSINQYQATNQTNFGLYRSSAVSIVCFAWWLWDDPSPSTLPHTVSH